MKNLLVRLFGFSATVLHGDPTVYDRFRWLRKNLLRGNLRTLDAGCGTGAFTLFAAKSGNQAVGISFNERNMEIAKERASLLQLENARFIQGDLRRMDKLSDSLEPFDQILCFETVEHLIDDKKLLRDLSAKLKPGGRLLLTTPYKGHYPVLGEPQDPNFVSQIEDGGHVRYGYTEGELKVLFETAGLELTQVDFVSGYISQRLYNAWCIADRHLPHKLTWLLTLPLRILQSLDSTLTLLLKYPGFSIAVVGVKKQTS